MHAQSVVVPAAAVHDSAPSRLSTNHHRLARRLLREMGTAIADFDMIRPDDRIMVCVSGGKDSHVLLHLLCRLRDRAPVPFTLIAVNLDQKQPGFPKDVLPTYFARIAVPYRIVEQDTYSVVKEKVPFGKTTCGLCSRLRRGILYKTARALNCNVLALGHHADDILETFFLNLFFGGQLAAMAPHYTNDDGDIRIIRPLANSFENDIARFARSAQFPIIPCNLCGSQENLKRQEIKKMIAEWVKTYPDRRVIMRRALTHLRTDRLPICAADGAFTG